MSSFSLLHPDFIHVHAQIPTAILRSHTSVGLRLVVPCPPRPRVLVGVLVQVQVLEFRSPLKPKSKNGIRTYLSWPKRRLKPHGRYPSPTPSFLPGLQKVENRFTWLHLTLSGDPKGSVGKQSILKKMITSGKNLLNPHRLGDPSSSQRRLSKSVNRPQRPSVAG